MNYKKYTIDTTVFAEESVSFILSEFGITFIEVVDNLPVEDELCGTYDELQPDIEGDMDSCKVCFYLDEYSDDPSDYIREILGDFSSPEDYEIALSQLLSNLRDRLSSINEYMDAGSLKITCDTVRDEDWRDNWKKYFSAFTIGDILIRPTWDDTTQPTDNQQLIKIDPGMSFGTGKHETTMLCIRGLQRYLKLGDDVLDLGFGSGILSLVAKKLGAGSVSGTDIDADCIASARENFAENDLEFDESRFYIGDLCHDASLQQQVGFDKYDTVVANILAAIIIDMAPAIYATMKPGATLISSGIINFKADEVERALCDAGFTVLERETLGEWVGIVCKK